MMTEVFVIKYCKLEIPEKRKKNKQLKNKVHRKSQRTMMKRKRKLKSVATQKTQFRIYLLEITECRDEDKGNI